VTTLQIRPFLFVLDNFEQVCPPIGGRRDIKPLPRLFKVLLAASVAFYGGGISVAPLAPDTAVQLLYSGQSRLRPNFLLTAENSPAIRTSVYAWMVLPLADRLGGARTKSVPSAILTGCKAGLQLLIGGALDLPKRQTALATPLM